MITNCSSRSVMADAQVIVRLQVEDTVPGSPAGSASCRPGGDVTPGYRHGCRGVRGPASDAHRRRSWVTAGAVIRPGSGGGLRAGPGREAGARVLPAG